MNIQRVHIWHKRQRKAIGQSIDSETTAVLPIYVTYDAENSCGQTYFSMELTMLGEQSMGIVSTNRHRNTLGRAMMALPTISPSPCHTIYGFRMSRSNACVKSQGHSHI